MSTAGLIETVGWTAEIRFERDSQEVFFRIETRDTALPIIEARLTPANARSLARMLRWAAAEVNAPPVEETP